MYTATPANPILSVIEKIPILQDMFNTVHGHRSLHYGAKKTYLTLCQRYPGHGIPLRVIQDMVAECPICQKDRLPFNTVPSATITETIMHHKRTIGMDHVTVTPPDEDGYIGLLLIVGHDTKYPTAYTVRDYTAPTVATISFKHYCTYGAYDALFSDPGSAIAAAVVKELNNWLNIPQKISIVGRHESNGTEHVNGLFIGHLRRLVHDERLTTQWASDTILPLINHALCTTPNSELGGFSPAELKFGTTDYHRFNLPPPLPPGHSYGEYVNRLDKNLATIRAITAQYQLELRRKRQAPTPQHLQNTYQPGDFILWNPKEIKSSFRASKLSPSLLGPYTVTKQEGSNISCYHNQLDTQHTFHSDRVTPFIGSITVAYDMGLLDKEEYIVEKIISHRGTWNRLKSIELFVRWDGCTAAQDSWEPWSSMRRVKALHGYLKTIGKERYIPAKLNVFQP